MMTWVSQKLYLLGRPCPSSMFLHEGLLKIIMSLIAHVTCSVLDDVTLENPSPSHVQVHLLKAGAHAGHIHLLYIYTYTEALK